MLHARGSLIIVIAGLMLAFGQTFPLTETHSCAAEATKANAIVGTNAAKAAPQVEEWDFDFVNARLYGKDILGMSLDSATDLLGRPSSISDPISRQYSGRNVRLGALVRYEQKGLLLQFAHPQDNQAQPCVIMTVFLANQRDSGLDRDYQFTGFQGKISKNVRADWKAKKFLQEFADLSPRDMGQDPETIAREMEARNTAQKALALDRDMPGPRVLSPALQADLAQTVAGKRCEEIIIDRPTHRILVSYERTTKFIERICILRNPNKN